MLLPGGVGHTDIDSMSYKSIKRVLGETSLERKFLSLFGSCLLLLITGSFWFYGSQTEKLVNEQNLRAGELLVDQAMVIRHWGVYDEEGRRTFFETLGQEEVSKQDFTSTFILPGSIDSSETTNKPKDEFEWAVLDRFVKAELSDSFDPEVAEYDHRLSPDKEQFEYYQAVRAEQSCLRSCHQRVGRSEVMPETDPEPMYEGDLIAVVKITISNAPTQKAIDFNNAVLLTTAIVTVFLAMIASYVIVRYVIVKPLRHLRDVSDAISHGDIALRAEIHTGDEFESLALAFNRMLRHLVAAQQELREVNTDLDAKVDELAQVNMRLYEMNTIKSDFLATMSHELRTPLNSILGFSDVLGSIDALNDKQKRYVENIQTSGRMLLDMINDILDLAKIESGKMNTRLSDFHVEQVINAQCDMARPLAERKNIDIDIAVVGNLPAMHQDQARTQQILNNLLSNAVKFTPEGGRITVSAANDIDRNMLLMEISDTGVGIAEEDQQVIFEKFRQGHTGMPGDDAMTREYSGTGLGLSIVRELCRLLGGDVSVQSELGKGSTFAVQLPWTLQEQPRLDSSMVEGLDDFTRPRFELLRGPRQTDSAETESGGHE